MSSRDRNMTSRPQLTQCTVQVYMKIYKITLCKILINNGITQRLGYCKSNRLIFDIFLCYMYCILCPKYSPMSEPYIFYIKLQSNDYRGIYLDRLPGVGDPVCEYSPPYPDQHSITCVVEPATDGGTKLAPHTPQRQPCRRAGTLPAAGQVLLEPVV